MALGSSAPEILLSIISTVKDLEAVPPEIGPSTIVGSAAYNLLVISAVSILAVGDEVKAIADIGTFSVTSIFSLFAYIWMYIVLEISTPGEVEFWEGLWTFIFFFILVIVSYTSDRVNSCTQERRQTEADRIKKQQE